MFVNILFFREKSVGSDGKPEGQGQSQGQGDAMGSGPSSSGSKEKMSTSSNNTANKQFSSRISRENSPAFFSEKVMLL